MWIALAIISASFLGIYDISRKTSVHNNAVLPVLYISTLTSTLLFLPLLLISTLNPLVLRSTCLFIPFSGWANQGLIFIKSLIVVSSWILTFFATKYLPLTIVSPIRSSGPVWTLLGALVFFGERLNGIQWIGLIISFVFFYLFTLAGSNEGISLRSNKWLIYVIGGTLLGAVSGLYDKYLIAHNRIDKMEVQAWFSVYQAVILTPIIFLLWFPGRKQSTPFRWSWTIPMIGLFLVIADFAYFYAISLPGSLISMISTIRRSNVIISFSAGVFMFTEKNIRQRAFLMAGIMIGVVIMYFGS